jgi:8-oxo-dGTP diphosphatase|tara:strand:+ start:910 stop:1614 length:705 start_codon:yes stop_codon:yes gene_type:complete
MYEKERAQSSTHFTFGISVDCVVFGFDGSDVKVLVIKRGTEPYLNFSAIPGDLVHEQEDPLDATKRVLNELTGLKDIYLEQLKAFAGVNRHPLGRVVTIAYYSLIKISDYNPQPSSWATDATWTSIQDIEEMAFDHFEIFSSALNRLQERVRLRPIGFELLPEEFTLAELQYLYEKLLDQTFDKANFRKKILSMDLLIPLEKMQKAVRHRPARMYRFDSNRYADLTKKNFHFEL